MSRRRVAAVLAILLQCVVMTQPLRAAEYSSPKGFRVEYPDDWQVASEQGREAIGEATRQLFKNHNIDLSQMDVMIFRPGSDPMQNVNIVVSSGSVPSGKECLPQVEAEIRRMMTSAGIVVEKMDSSVVTVCGKEVILSTRTIIAPNSGSKKIQQRQYVIPGSHHGYIITCSAGNENIVDAEAAFTRIVNSFAIVSEPDRTPGEWWAGLPRGVRDLIVGAGIGLAIAVVISVFRKSSKKA